MENPLQDRLIALLNQCFEATNVIHKFLNEPAHPDVLRVCTSLTDAINRYMEERKEKD